MKRIPIKKIPDVKITYANRYSIRLLPSLCAAVKNDVAQAHIHFGKGSVAPDTVASKARSYILEKRPSFRGEWSWMHTIGLSAGLNNPHFKDMSLGLLGKLLRVRNIPEGDVLDFFFELFVRLYRRRGLSGKTLVFIHD
jgi:hypothetical protein